MTTKSVFLILLSCWLAGGCATSTIQSRIQEKQAAFAALSPEMQQAVQEGQIRLGMTADAVYMAWGSPSDVTTSENAQGKRTTWLYYGTWMQETRYWTYREVAHGDRRFLERYLARDYNPRDYVRAEIVFVDGKVKTWKTLPRPVQ